MLSKVRKISKINDFDDLDHTLLFDPFFYQRESYIFDADEEKVNAIYQLNIKNSSTDQYITRSYIHLENISFFHNYLKEQYSLYPEQKIFLPDSGNFAIWKLDIEYFIFKTIKERVWSVTNLESSGKIINATINKFQEHEYITRDIRLRNAEKLVNDEIGDNNMFQDLFDSGEEVPRICLIEYTGYTTLANINTKFGEIREDLTFMAFVDDKTNFGNKFSFSLVKRMYIYKNVYRRTVSIYNWLSMIPYANCRDPLIDPFLYSEKGNNALRLYQDKNFHKQFFNTDDVDYAKEHKYSFLCYYYCHRFLSEKYLYGDAYDPDEDFLTKSEFDKMSEKEGRNDGRSGGIMYLNSNKYDDKIFDMYEDDAQDWVYEFVERLKQYDLELLSILAVVFIAADGNYNSELYTMYHSIYYTLAYEITDEWRKETDSLFELLVKWYEEKGSDDDKWDDLANRVGHFSPYGMINNNHHAINTLLYGLYKSSFKYITRTITYNQAVKQITPSLTVIPELSSAEMVNLFSDRLKKYILDSYFNMYLLKPPIRMANNTFFIMCVVAALKLALKDLKFWSIYRKQKCANDDALNIYAGMTHKESDKRENVISVGYILYDCHDLEDLTMLWDDQKLLEEKGFMDPDFDGKEGSREVFTYNEIKDLIRYLEKEIKNEDKATYQGLLKILKKNLGYSDVDTRLMTETKKYISVVDRETLLKFFSYLLVVIFYARFWRVKRNKHDQNADDVPYDKDRVSMLEINNKAKGKRDYNVQIFVYGEFDKWMSTLDEDIQVKLKSLKNIQPNVNPPPKYTFDKRSDFTITQDESVGDVSVDVSKATGDESEAEEGESESGKPIEVKKKIRKLPKNTLYGRIFHGIYNGGSCFGINGDLIIDNLKIYNELFFDYEINEYENLITKNIREITGVNIEKIVLADFLYTHGGGNNIRMVGAESHY